MRQVDPRHFQPREALIDEALVLEVKMRGAFVEKENAGPPVQCPCQQQPLLLPALQRWSNVQEDVIAVMLFQTPRPLLPCQPLDLGLGYD